MLTTIIGLILVLGAAFWVAWPLLAGTSAASEAAPADGERSPEHEKEIALRAIREADFDHRTGKLSDEDYAVLREELDGRAMSAMAELDAASALHAVPLSTPAAQAGTAPAARIAAEPGGFCPACGVRFARDARFCPGCGKKLSATTPRGRRRA